jgi:lysophospholipase L1-like esterase
VTKRPYRRVAAAGAAIICCCLVLSAWIFVRVRDADASRAVSSVLIEPHRVWPRPAPARSRPPLLSVATPLAACEQRIEHQPGRLPTVAIVGASYTAGTGPGNPELSWAVVLARLLHWNAVVYGVPGAGYTVPSPSGRGPIARMLGREDLRALGPALVIVQAGHDDLGVPPELERERVTQVIGLIRAEAPDARIALVTVFPGRRRPAADYQTDQVIVTAARAADPDVLIMDPLTQGWTFPRTHDGLHPTAAGDAWIARKVAGLLSRPGIRPAAPSGTGGPVICDSGIPVGPNTRVRPQPR